VIELSRDFRFGTQQTSQTCRATSVDGGKAEGAFRCHQDRC
jgi:hypothetical protein